MRLLAWLDRFHGFILCSQLNGGCLLNNFRNGKLPDNVETRKNFGNTSRNGTGWLVQLCSHHALGTSPCHRFVNRAYPNHRRTQHAPNCPSGAPMHGGCVGVHQGQANGKCRSHFRGSLQEATLLGARNLAPVLGENEFDSRSSAERSCSHAEGIWLVFSRHRL